MHSHRWAQNETLEGPFALKVKARNFLAFNDFILGSRLGIYDPYQRGCGFSDINALIPTVPIFTKCITIIIIMHFVNISTVGIKLLFEKTRFYFRKFAIL